MYIISKIKALLSLITRGLKLKKFRHSRSNSSKYIWMKIRDGLFKDRELFLPKEWNLKVIQCNHEVEVFDIIKNLAPKLDVMYDIGAHYGWFSVAWICAGGKYVEAFEPANENAIIMKKTILKNGYQNQINLHKIALSDMTSEDDLYIHHRDSSRNFINRSSEYENPNDFRVERVKTFCLDDFQDNIKKPGLIKIDVEGLEYEVLKGAKNLVTETSPIIVAEIHDFSNALEVANFLCKMGYDMEILGYKGRNKTLPIVMWKK